MTSYFASVFSNESAFPLRTHVNLLSFNEMLSIPSQSTKDCFSTGFEKTISILKVRFSLREDTFSTDTISPSLITPALSHIDSIS